MSAVHQLIAGASPGDAVTEQALRLRALLREWGHASEIVAEHVHPALAGDVHRLDAGGARRVQEAEGLVVRYSIWSAAADAALRSAAPLAVVYHNVTPPEHLRAANPAVAEMCEMGRRRLGDLAGRATAVLADSRFNARDVHALGIDDVTVVPLLIDPVEPPPAAGAPPDGPHMITVGRIVPNKRIEDVVRVHALLRRSRADRARLTVVGSASGFEPYRTALDRQVAHIGAGGVRFTGRVSEAERDAVYRAGSAYVCMSVHEGFCLPLVEAMQRGVPIVARAAAAVPETLGGAGVVLDDDDLGVFAEAVWEVSTSEALRTELARRAADRLRDLHPARVAPLLRGALAPVLGVPA